MTRTPLQKVSDAMLPDRYADILYKTIFFKIGPTDVNGWSIVHFASGILLSSIMNGPVIYGFYIHTTWELFQFVIGDNLLDLESFIDISMDTLMFLSGWVLGIRYSMR